MLAAFVVLPTFALVYLLGAPVGLRRRLVGLTLGSLVLALVSMSWMAVYDLTPADKRPYAGTTDSNLVLELAVGPYGIGRFVRQPRPSAIAASESGAGQTETTGAAADAGRGALPRPRTGLSRLFVRTPVGPLRLADGQLAGQATLRPQNRRRARSAALRGLAGLTGGGAESATAMAEISTLQLACVASRETSTVVVVGRWPPR